MILAVTDERDERLRPFVAVRDPELAARDGVFVAEGREVVRRVLRSCRHRVRSLLVSGAALAALHEDLGALSPDVPVLEIPHELTERLTGFHIHRGCLALVERPAARAWREVAEEAGRRPLVVLEDVGNPDNVGGVFRNARALGAGGVLLNDRCSDPLYRKAIRTSMGAAIEVPFAVIAPWPDSIDALRGVGWHVVALVPGAPAGVVECRARTAATAGVAVLAGHEGQGLSAGARARADEEVAIRMAPGADSLNVSVAVAIALHELRRE
jgi:tRNA G18 (ribose-2'-O)-methylase SpoU